MTRIRNFLLICASNTLAYLRFDQGWVRLNKLSLTLLVYAFPGTGSPGLVGGLSQRSRGVGGRIPAGGFGASRHRCGESRAAARPHKMLRGSEPVCLLHPEKTCSADMSDGSSPFKSPHQRSAMLQSNSMQIINNNEAEPPHPSPSGSPGTGWGWHPGQAHPCGMPRDAGVPRVDGDRHGDLRSPAPLSHRPPLSSQAGNKKPTGLCLLLLDLPAQRWAGAGGSSKGRHTIAKYCNTAALPTCPCPARGRKRAAQSASERRAGPPGELRGVPAAEQPCGSGDCRWQSHLASGREAGAAAAGSARGQHAGEGAPLLGEPPEPLRLLAPCRGERVSSGWLLHARCALTKSQCYFHSKE